VTRGRQRTDTVVLVWAMGSLPPRVNYTSKVLARDVDNRITSAVPLWPGTGLPVLRTSLGAVFPGTQAANRNGPKGRNPINPINRFSYRGIFVQRLFWPPRFFPSGSCCFSMFVRIHKACQLPVSRCRLGPISAEALARGPTITEWIGRLWLMFVVADSSIVLLISKGVVGSECVSALYLQNPNRKMKFERQIPPP